MDRHRQWIRNWVRKLACSMEKMHRDWEEVFMQIWVTWIKIKSEVFSHWARQCCSSWSLTVHRVMPATFQITGGQYFTSKQSEFKVISSKKIKKGQNTENWTKLLKLERPVKVTLPSCNLQVWSRLIVYCATDWGPYSTFLKFDYWLRGGRDEGTFRTFVCFFLPRREGSVRWLR